MMVFGAVFVAGGTTVAYGVVLRPMVDARAAAAWIPTTCRVLRSEVRPESTSKGKRVWGAAVHYEYQAGGRRHEGSRRAFTPPVSTSDRDDAEDIVARYPIGADVPCWFDPADPASATLSRTVRGSLWFAFPLPFLVVGFFVMRYGARLGRDRRPGTPASGDGRFVYLRRGSGNPEVAVAAWIAGLIGTAAALAFSLGLSTVATIAAPLAGVALAWFAHEVRCALSVVSIVAPAQLERDAKARIEHDVRTPFGSPPVSVRALALETKRVGSKTLTSTVETVEVDDGILRIEGPPSRDTSEQGHLAWFIEVRTHLPYGPDLYVRAPIRVT